MCRLSWEIQENWSNAEGECQDSIHSLHSLRVAGWATRCVPNLKPVHKSRAFQDKERGFLHRETGRCAPVCCMHNAPGAVAGNEPSIQSPQSRGTEECKYPCSPQPGNQGASLGWQLQKPGHQLQVKLSRRHALLEYSRGRVQNSADPLRSLERIPARP